MTPTARAFYAWALYRRLRVVWHTGPVSWNLYIARCHECAAAAARRADAGVG